MDDSSPSTAALEYALSQHPDAEITVLHVIGGVGGMDSGSGVALPMDDDRAEEAATQLFAEAQRLADDYGVELSTVTERGSPARSITAFTRTHEIDHVIMGSHGRTGVSRLLFGSVAERVVRRAPVTVTVVP